MAEERDDWTPFYEVTEAVEHLRWLVFRRWGHRELKDSDVAKDVQDALDDLRPLVGEATGIWRRLARYRPRRDDA